MAEPCQCTLASVVSMSGRGLHTGEDCRIAVHPAEPSTGIIFSTPYGPVPAVVENVSDTRRGTTLRSGDAEIRTVEHLLAAFAGIEIDNAVVEVTGIELPAADGSALPFVELLETGGRASQPCRPRQIAVREALWAVEREKFLLAAPGSGFTVHALIDFPHPMIGLQTMSVALDPDVFRREIAPARTFCTSDEIEAIQAQGLGLGGTPDNVVVAGPDGYSVGLRFDNEFVRHKVLDLIGDLALTRGRLDASITAIKTSHTLNTDMAAKLFRLARSEP